MKGEAGVSEQWRGRRRDGRRRCCPDPPRAANLPRTLPTAHRDGRWGDRRADGTWGGEPPAARLVGGVQSPVQRARTPRGLFVVDTRRSRWWRSACRPVDPSDRLPSPPKRGSRRRQLSHEKPLKPLRNSVRLPYARRRRPRHFPPVTHLGTRPPTGAKMRCATTAVTRPPSRVGGGETRGRAQRAAPSVCRDAPAAVAHPPGACAWRAACGGAHGGGARARRAGGGSSGAPCGTAHDEWAPPPSPFPRAPTPAAATRNALRGAGRLVWRGPPAADATPVGLRAPLPALRARHAPPLLPCY